MRYQLLQRRKQLFPLPNKQRMALLLEEELDSVWVAELVKLLEQMLGLESDLKSEEVWEWTLVKLGVLERV